MSALVEFDDETRKTAIFLMALGQEHAGKVIPNLSDADVERISACITSLGQVKRDGIETAIAEFVEDIRDQTAFGIDNDDYLESLLFNALGSERAQRVLDRLNMLGEPANLEALKSLEPNVIFEILRDEHPQIISVVISLIEGKKAAELLKMFPEESHNDFVLRVANLNTVTPQALRELDHVLERALGTQTDSGSTPQSVGGASTAAALINAVGGDMAEGFKAFLLEHDEALGKKIDDLLFVFEDLMALDDRAIQTLLRDVSTDDLVVALKGASEPLFEKILRNMSSRAAEMLRDDIDARGPVRVADVEEAQKRICNQTKELEAQGKIMLGGSDDFV
ncbi:MAG: flagellar motor switch protein FliG [Pseudomonadota bacterium]